MGINYSGQNLPPGQSNGCAFEWKAFDTTSQPSGSSAVNLRDTNHTGRWTNNQSNNPSANQNATIATVSGVRCCQVYNGNNPSKWLWFSGSSTYFNGGSGAISTMWWLYNNMSASGDYHWGGQDGSPNWTNGGNITNATAGMNGIRGSQWEFIGHGFDNRMGSTTDTQHRLQTGGWQLVIMCADGEGCMTYVDGELDGYNHYNSGKNTANTNFFIGRSWSKEDLSGMSGYIAWVASWKKMLTEADATEIWNHTRSYFGR